MLKKNTLSLALAMALSLGVMMGAEASSQQVNVIINPPATAQPMATTQSGATVNWGKGSASDIEVIGLGLPSGIGAQGTVTAKRAALVDAYRNMLEATQGVQVDSETTVEQMMLVSDTVKTRVSGMVRGTKVVAQGFNSDGSYYVKLRMPLYGEGGLASAVVPQIAPTAPVPFAAPSDSFREYPPAMAYTGVIIDARGLGLETTFSPAIYDENGRGIYGISNIDADYAINYGMVEYARKDITADPALAAASRAGMNPLVIKAVAAKKSVNGVTKVSAVVSAADADKILAYNQSTGFLGKCAVVFEI